VSRNLKDILSHFSSEIDQDTLLRYLNGLLTEEEKHEVEKKMLENEFNDDAMEGLQQFRNKANISVYLEQLDRDLKTKLQKKKKRREKLNIKDQPWLYVAIVIVLLLIVISYLVVTKVLKHQ
jgi:hypothetical protein